MKNILFYDTETSGQLDFKAPPDAPHQPRLLQLGLIMTDTTGNEIAIFKTLIRPDGWQIQPGAQAVHGITQEQAERDGIPLMVALNTFWALAATCQGKVCHNSDFDSKIMLGEQLRSKAPPSLSEIPHFCTMKATTNVCRLPGPYGFKWPKLGEAYKHCTGK